ncbi:UNVERIFIED_CONTAM: hypothetical protein FKN15_067729 [Acipenser sinensis]
MALQPIIQMYALNQDRALERDISFTRGSLARNNIIKITSQRESNHGNWTKTLQNKITKKSHHSNVRDAGHSQYLQGLQPCSELEHIFVKDLKRDCEEAVFMFEGKEEMLDMQNSILAHIGAQFKDIVSF